MKYKYIGTEPALLIDFNKDVQPEDVVEVDGPINSPLFVLVEETPKGDKKPKEASSN